jgi:hypothetical protein
MIRLLPPLSQIASIDASNDLGVMQIKCLHRRFIDPRTQRHSVKKCEPGFPVLLTARISLISLNLFAMMMAVFAR